MHKLKNAMMRNAKSTNAKPRNAKLRNALGSRKPRNAIIKKCKSLEMRKLRNIKLINAAAKKCKAKRKS